MNHRADSGKKNLSAVASEPRNNKTWRLLSHTASRDRDTNRNETPFTPAIPRFFGSNAGKSGMQPPRANPLATLFHRTRW
jgi:hypothetical protein